MFRQTEPPLPSLSWLLFYKDGNTPEIQAALRDFMIWAMGPGQEMAAELSYVPLSEIVKEQVLAQIPLIQ